MNRLMDYVAGAMALAGVALIAFGLVNLVHAVEVCSQ